MLATVPMWFGLLREDQAQPMISELAAPEHQADWGMRIIANTASRYSGGGYHYGSVWPLFTGWASVGEYLYHRDLRLHTGTCEPMPCSRSMARSAMSRKFCPAINTNRCRRVLRTRSGRRRW